MNKLLFPKGEAWATGDEAIDLKLTQKLESVFNDFRFETISEFYFYAISLKTRAYNPAFGLSIEQIAEALLFELDPNTQVDINLKKMKGKYRGREFINVHLDKLDIVIEGLRMLRKFRYKDQIDFFLVSNISLKKNPFTELRISVSEDDLQTKIIFKELRECIQSGQTEKLTEDFFRELAANKVVVVHGLGEFWFNQDQIYSISYM